MSCRIVSVAERAAPQRLQTAVAGRHFEYVCSRCDILYGGLCRPTGRFPGWNTDRVRVKTEARWNRLLSGTRVRPAVSSCHAYSPLLCYCAEEMQLTLHTATGAECLVWCVTGGA